tara:strand:+ start:635 stop:1273 length:639 start_codon:yes stop_codon:yes gene_type:complete
MVKDIKLYLLISILLILFCGVIASNVRVSKLNSKCKKIQKHLLYQQNILDKHKKLFDENLKMLPNQVVSKELQKAQVEVQPVSFDDMQSVQDTDDVIEIHTVERNNNNERTRRENPITTILPLVTSMMTMMNQPDTVPNLVVENSLPTPTNVIEEVDYEKIEEEKRMMEVIQEEINEMKIRKEDEESGEKKEEVIEVTTPIVKEEVPGIQVQ